MDVSVLRPSDIDRLVSGARSDQLRSEILNSLNRMLRETPVDGGADSDRITSCAHFLNMGLVWEWITPAELSEAILMCPPPAVDLFVRGLEKKHAQYVRHLLEQSERNLVEVDRLSPKGVETVYVGLASDGRFQALTDLPRVSGTEKHSGKNTTTRN